MKIDQTHIGIIFSLSILFILAFVFSFFRLSQFNLPISKDNLKVSCSTVKGQKVDLASIRYEMKPANVQINSNASLYVTFEELHFLLDDYRNELMLEVCLSYNINSIEVSKDTLLWEKLKDGYQHDGILVTPKSKGNLILFLNAKVINKPKKFQKARVKYEERIFPVRYVFRTARDSVIYDAVKIPASDSQIEIRFESNTTTDILKLIEVISAAIGFPALVLLIISYLLEKRTSKKQPALKS